MRLRTRGHAPGGCVPSPAPWHRRDGLHVACHLRALDRVAGEREEEEEEEDRGGVNGHLIN